LSGFVRSSLALWAVLAMGFTVTNARAEALDAAPGGLCAMAAQAAEQRYGLPTGLLFAIGQVESGRPDAATHQRQPWPWTVQSMGQSYYFASKAAAVAWVQAAQAKGDASIDTGCLQVNLMYHPHAFQTVDVAFDPAANADYAARFLLSLHASTGDWRQAVGFYHSQTLALAVPYRQRVEDALNDRLPGGDVAMAPPPPTQLSLLQTAWAATLDPQGAPSAPAETNDWTIPSPAPVPHASVRRRARRDHGEVLLSYAH
jgi:hypothetical protein